MDDFLRDWIKDNLSNMDANISKIVVILSEDFYGGTWYSFAVNVKGLVQPVALTIVTICFLIEFLKITIQMDILKWEYGLRVMFKFVFAKVCMDGAFYLLSAIYATSMEWIASIGNNSTTVGDLAWKAIAPIVEEYGMFKMLGVAISLGIMFLAIWAISLLVQVIAYARKFELVMYLAISPLPCAFLPLEDGGASRIPKKFVASFASVCLQGVFMVMSVKLFSLLCLEALNQAITNGTYIGGIVGELFIAVCVLMMAVMKSSSWAKSILDAQ